MVKTIAFILILIIGVCGVLPNTSIGLRLNKQFLAIFSVMSLFALFFLKNKWLQLFIFWSIFRTTLAFWGKSFDGEYYMTLNTIFIGVIFYQILVDNLKTQIKTVHLLNGICVIGLINLLWMLLQFYGLWIFILPIGLTKDCKLFLQDYPLHIVMSPMFKYSITGVMGNVNITSALIVLTLPAFFRKNWYWGIPLTWVGLISAHSLGGTVPAGIITLWFIIYKKKYWLAGLLIVLGSVYLIKNEKLPDVVGIRIPMWWAVFKNLITRHWLIGWGVGKFQIAVKNYGGTQLIRFTELHNEPLELWYEQGILPLLLMFGFICSLIKGYIKANKGLILTIAFMGLIITLINSGVNFLFHVAPGIIGICWLSILTKETNKISKEGIC